jgi:hypothetical protein
LPGYDNEMELGQIRFKPDGNTKFVIPTSDTIMDKYPYTGSGFIGSTDGRTVPEYFKTDQNIPEGSELWIMNSNGQWTHISTYSLGKWGLI